MRSTPWILRPMSYLSATTGQTFPTTSPNSLDNMYLTLTGRGKGTVYESGSRVGFAVRGPGIEAGSESTEFIHATDIYNTCLNLAGLLSVTQNRDRNNITVDSDSISLTPILFGDVYTVRDPNEDYILTETSYGGNQTGARNSSYKVLARSSYIGGVTYEFYNLLDDPLEEYNLEAGMPDSCGNYEGEWDRETDPEWHYCHLKEMISQHSIVTN